MLRRERERERERERRESNKCDTAVAKWTLLYYNFFHFSLFDLKVHLHKRPVGAENASDVDTAVLDWLLFEPRSQGK